MGKLLTNAAGWVLLVFGLIALSSLSADLLTQLQQSPVELWGVLWVAIASIIVVMLVGLLFDRTRIRKEPGQFGIWVTAFVFGALISPWISLKGNNSFDNGLIALLSSETYWSWNAAISAPLVEEVAKAAVVVGIFAVFSDRITRPLQALFVGVAVGFGFQFTENVFYGFSGAFENIDGDFIGGAQILLLRLITGFFSHWNYAAFTAVGVGLLYGITYRERTKRWRNWAAIGLFATSLVMHFVWNSPLTTANFFISSTISQIIGLGIFALFVRYLAREDRRVRGLPTPRQQRAAKKAAKQDAKALAE